MSLGREAQSHSSDPVGRIASALERLAVANEDIVKLAKADGDPPVIEVEPGPPFCPHCGRQDPTIVIHSGEGRGPMSEWFLDATCAHCEMRLFGIPQGWTMTAKFEDVQAHMKGGKTNAS